MAKKRKKKADPIKTYGKYARTMKAKPSAGRAIAAGNIMDRVIKESFPGKKKLTAADKAFARRRAKAEYEKRQKRSRSYKAGPAKYKKGGKVKKRG